MAKKQGAAPQTASALLDVYVSEFMQRIGKGYVSDKKMSDIPTGRTILKRDRECQAAVVESLLDRLRVWEQEDMERRAAFNKKVGRRSYLTSDLSKLETPEERADSVKHGKRGQIFRQTLDEMLRRKLSLSEATMIRLLRWPFTSPPDVSYPLHSRCLSGIVNTVENFAAANEGSPAFHTALRAFISKLPHDSWFDKNARITAERLKALLPGGPQVHIKSGEAWSDAALADLKQMKAQQGLAWNALLVHCQRGGKGKFTPRWRQEAEPLLTAVGFEDFKAHVLRWFPLVDKPRTRPLGWAPVWEHVIKPPHVELLRGLVWCCGFQEDADLARALMRLAVSSYRKIPGRGPRMISLGNACLTALKMIPGQEPIGQLAVLKARVKAPIAQKEIEKAFHDVAARANLPREEIEELAVPSYGLEEVGLRRQSFGDYQAELTVDGSTASLHWHKEGKPIQSVPAAVKKEHPEEVKELQAAVKDLNAMLPAQRERLDTLFLAQKSWPLAVWRERYLDHPLVGTIARRLIWTFTTRGKTTDGIWFDGDLVGVNGKPLHIKDSATVALWHPIGHAIEDVLAWRDWLERREVVQPFKQAHREVYLLTDAERRTRTYSNRFASHILRQHQFHALCAARGWKDQLRLMVDTLYPPAQRLLPAWNLRAEYWVEGASTVHDRATNETGTFLYLATDQVRFYALDAPPRYARAGGRGRAADKPLPLEHVPPLVFSEIMRDVDLFVGVASVGNDPNWSDGGPGGRYRDYWQSYSFGDLSVTAQTRRALLERLIPRLKIADRCTLSERFLVVRGDLRGYKIHLGSGNILMTPNNQYLCIVPSQTTASHERVFLPFEGDNTLSVILSKAFLLAEDAKITDSSITSQLHK